MSLFQITDINHSQERKVVERRECLTDPTHGGKPCSSGDAERVVQWYFFNLGQLSFDQANYWCSTVAGGVLFSSVDGTKEQLDFFHSLTGKQDLWTGTEPGAFKSVNRTFCKQHSRNLFTSSKMK